MFVREIRRFRRRRLLLAAKVCSLLALLPSNAVALSAPITSKRPEQNPQKWGSAARRGLWNGAAAPVVAAAAAARGTPVEVCVKFVVVVPSMRGGGIAGTAERNFVSRSAID